MAKITSKMAYERKKAQSQDQASTERDNRLFKARFAKSTHVLPPNTYRKHGITLPGKYYGDKALEETTLDGRTNNLPVNRRADKYVDNPE